MRGAGFVICIILTLFSAGVGAAAAAETTDVSAGVRAAAKGATFQTSSMHYIGAPNQTMTFLTAAETSRNSAEFGLPFIGISENDQTCGDAASIFSHRLQLVDTGACRGVRCNKDGMVPGTLRACNISLSGVGGLVMCTEMADFYLTLKRDGGAAVASSCRGNSSSPRARTISSRSGPSP